MERFCLSAGESSSKILRFITRLNIGGLAQHAVCLTSGLNEGVFESKLLAGKINQTYFVFLVEFRITESGIRSLSPWNRASGEHLDHGRVGIPRGSPREITSRVRHQRPGRENIPRDLPREIMP